MTPMAIPAIDIHVVKEMNASLRLERKYRNPTDVS
jgi:hypothetical protein